VVDTRVAGHQTRIGRVADQPQRLARDRQAVLDLRADRDPLDESPEGVAEGAVELVAAVVADLVAEQAGTDADADGLVAHVANSG